MRERGDWTNISPLEDIEPQICEEKRGETECPLRTPSPQKMHFERATGVVSPEGKQAMADAEKELFRRLLTGSFNPPIS